MSSNGLPASEREFLAGLPRNHLSIRLRDLNKAGWSLHALANSLTPPRPRTTVHYWISNSHAPTPASFPPAYPPPPPQRAIRAVAPTVPPHLRPRLRELARLAARNRAKIRPDAPQARASAELTEIAHLLRSQGVPTAQIAEAAGVSYRAMHRRLSP
jgi:hypothetical protein